MDPNRRLAELNKPRNRAGAQHFIDCIIRDEKPLSDGSDSCKDVIIIEDLLKKAMERENLVGA